MQMKFLFFSTNLEELIEYVTKKRKLTEDYLKFSLDGGGSFWISACLLNLQKNLNNKKVSVKDTAKNLRQSDLKILEEKNV